jgi:hypothetical protein
MGFVIGFMMGFACGFAVCWYKDPIVTWIKSKLPW